MTGLCKVSGCIGRPRRRRIYVSCACFLSCLFTASAGSALSGVQAGGPGAAATEVGAQESNQAQSTIIYDAAYFAPYAPVTLEDMIRNIPGGASLLSSLRSGGNDRGFGSSGAPLLINGRRMSGKSNDIATQLARIQASQVERIELIRGNAEGLDIRSEGILYNVILKESAENTSSNFISARLNYSQSAPLGPQTLLSHTGRRNGVDYGISYEYENKPRVSLIREDVLNPMRVPLEFRDLTRTRIDKTHTVTGNLGYGFQNGIQVRLNGLYEEEQETDERHEDQFLVDAGGARTFSAVEEAFFRFKESQWEIGGDLEAGVGFLGDLKALFVLTRTSNDDDLTQDLIAGGVTSPLFSQIADFDEGETIFRATLTTRLARRHTLEYGGEAALNTLDTVFSFDGGPFESAVVEEDRYEVFATHNFAISDRLSFQSGVTGEFSTISQNRDGVSNARSFQFMKPRFELRFDVTASDQLRLLAERTVSQLNLNDFVASRNTDDDLINFGNPDLSPESTWRYSLGYEKRFANDAGSFQIEGYYESIADHIDKILIGAASSGVGNIGDARRYGIETELNTRFGFIGAPNAVLTLEYEFQNTRVTDPFTGEARQIKRSSPHFWNFDFRHDIGNSKFTYGLSGHRRTITRRQDVSLREVTRYKRHVEAYGEYNLTKNTKLRFTAHRFLGDARNLDKTFYVGNIADDIIDRIDFQASSIKTQYDLRFQGTF